MSVVLIYLGIGLGIALVEFAEEGIRATNAGFLAWLLIIPGWLPILLHRMGRRDR